MNYILFLLQALISAAGVLILRASLDEIDYRNVSTSARDIAPIFLGVFLYGISFIMWLVILSKVEVSFAYPITIGLTLAFTLFGSYIFLGETLTLRAGIGIALISAGVLIAGTKTV
jgi:small multidrug resistance pump